MSKMDSQKLNFEIDDRDIFTVQQLNRSAKELLQQAFPLIWVEGEISNLARPASGHIYFSLKDEYAQVRCAMFRNSNRRLEFEPENGAHVLVRARVGMYEPRGDFQLTIENMKKAGIGLLQRKFDELKQKLSHEGLFDQAHKKALPTYPKNLAVITSATGAALRDIISVLKRRYALLKIYVYAVQVQGEQSASTIINAIQSINQQKKCEIILLARGGGTIEDLWSFNEESLARAIHASEIPVVTGIGHEVDFTIADFVADVRAPTPSSAAELITPHQQDLLEIIDQVKTTFVSLTQDKISSFTQTIDWITQRLELLHPEKIIAHSKERLSEMNRRILSALQLNLSYKQREFDKLLLMFENQSPNVAVQAATINLANLHENLIKAIHTQFEQKNQQFISATRTLDVVSPLGTLKRGYAIASKAESGQVLHDANSVAPGEKIQIQLAKGRILASVDDK